MPSGITKYPQVWSALSVKIGAAEMIYRKYSHSDER